MASSRLPLSSLMNSSSVSPPASGAAAEEAEAEAAEEVREVDADVEEEEDEEGSGGASKASVNSVVAFASNVNCAGATTMRDDDEL